MNFLSKLLKRADKIQQNDNLSSARVILPPKPDFIIEDEDEENEVDLIYKKLDNGEDLIRAIFGDFGYKIELISKGRKERFEIITKDFSSNVTHPGLIYYLGYCWGKEIGIVLRPDMIWSCVLYEFSKHIIETKDKYFDDFNNLYKKNMNVYDGYISSYDIVDKFRSFIKYDEFYRLIVKEKFDSEPKNFTLTKILTFCNFIRVEYKKHKVNCGIPKFQIKGDKQDWLKLLGLIDVLIHLISNRFFINYLENIKSIVSNIIMNTFQIMLSEPRLRYQGIREMIKDIFYIEKGKVMGWGRELYFDCYTNPSRKWNIEDFNTHISYLPFVNRKNREACVKTSGLCYSLIDNNCLEPFYGNMLCKIADVNIYKKL